MPISSCANTVEKKKLLKCKKKSLTPTTTAVTITNPKNQIKRSHSTLSLAKKPTNNEPIILQTHPDGSIRLSRTQEEKEKQADRICLDRRALAIIPILENEINLRLLSLQHNLLISLDQMKRQILPVLVFLDVYDNQIEHITNLDNLVNLRVLLMGKNRLRKVDGLQTLSKLEVLDLHGNQITSVSGLEHCQSLKVLNLAGNQLKTIGPNDLLGLRNLQELNLRRNTIRQVHGFSEMVNLQKLFLSNNDIQFVDDIHNLANAINIKELTIDNNPIFQTGDCVSFLVAYLPKLTNLNGMIVSEQVRKSAMAWRRKKELSNESFKDLSQNITLNGRREEVISNARTNWELLRTQTKYIATTSNHVEKSASIKPDSDIITTKFVKRDTKSKGNCSHSLTEKRKFNITRTNSMETDSSSNQSDPFRLPPILVPIINKLEPGSTSSIGPNVDSSVSSIASSNLSASEEEESEDEKIPNEEVVLEIPKINPVITNSPTAGETPPVITGVSSEQIDSSSNLSTNTSSSNNQSDSSSTKRHQKLKRAIKSASNPSTKVFTRTNRAITAKPQGSRKIINNQSDVNPPALIAIPREREQGGDYLIEICGRHLNIYGQGALRFVDKAWCQSKANDVHTVNFHYANFNGICGILHKVKVRFPNTENFIFKETNIYCLGQINALAEIQGLSSITILPEGNPIMEKDWREYAIFRLAHWGLKTINDKEVTESDVLRANETYASLSDLVLWSLPNDILQPLLSRLQISINDEEINCKQWLMTADPALRSVVSKEALQWKKIGRLTQDDTIMRQKAKNHLGNLLHELCNTIKKVQLFEERWPDILHEIVRNTLIDYSQLEIYTKHKLLELMKTCSS